MRLLTKDGVAIVEVRDGSLWTRAHSVTRCRMSQVQCEAALLFVPYVTCEQLEAIVRGIAKHGENPLQGPRTHALTFMIQKDAAALRDIARREQGCEFDYDATTLRRLRAYGFIDARTMVTAAGQVALAPKTCHLPGRFGDKGTVDAFLCGSKYFTRMMTR